MFLFHMFFMFLFHMLSRADAWIEPGGETSGVKITPITRLIQLQSTRSCWRHAGYITKTHVFLITASIYCVRRTQGVLGTQREAPYLAFGFASYLASFRNITLLFYLHFFFFQVPFDWSLRSKHTCHPSFLSVIVSLKLSMKIVFSYYLFLCPFSLVVLFVVGWR